MFRDEPKATEPEKQTLARGPCLWGGALQHNQTGVLGEGAARRAMSHAQSCKKWHVPSTEHCRHKTQLLLKAHTAQPEGGKYRGAKAG